MTERAVGTDLRLDDVLAEIDRANAADPTLDANGRPLALVQGRLASAWLDLLVDRPSPALAIAVRAHHLRRWELARSDHPPGRAGYLRWRRANKAHQASAASAILTRLGHDEATVQRVAELLTRRRLGTDPEAQIVEDAACLVFLQTAFDAMVARLDHDHLVAIVAKTLRKMSPLAIELAGEIQLSTAGAAVLVDARRTITA